MRFSLSSAICFARKYFFERANVYEVVDIGNASTNFRLLLVTFIFKCEDSYYHKLLIRENIVLPVAFFLRVQFSYETLIVRPGFLGCGKIS